jgi:hypothetical protein
MDADHILGALVLTVGALILSAIVYFVIGWLGVAGYIGIGAATFVTSAALLVAMERNQ